MANKYILDTHALIWFLEGNPKLGATAHSFMQNPNTELVLPIIALAEAAFIVERGRTRITTITNLITSIEAAPNLTIHPLTREVFDISIQATAVPEIHDRLIVGTALYLRNVGHVVSLLTADREIIASGLMPVIW